MSVLDFKQFVCKKHKDLDHDKVFVCYEIEKDVPTDDINPITGKFSRLGDPIPHTFDANMWKKVNNQYPGGFELVKEFDNESLITTNPVREIKIPAKQKSKVQKKIETKAVIKAESVLPMTVSKFKKSEYTKEQLRYIVKNPIEFSKTVFELSQKRLDMLAG